MLKIDIKGNFEVCAYPAYIRSLLMYTVELLTSGLLSLFQYCQYFLICIIIQIINVNRKKGYDFE